MSTAAEVLVIIVSSILAIFLIVSIILGIYLIKVSAEIRRIAKAAQKTVDSVESAVSGVSKMVSPVFVAAFVDKMIKKFMKGSKK